jgi:Zn-dependent peptidase ImmA (M78 family)
MTTIPPAWRNLAKNKAKEILEEVALGSPMKAPVPIHDIIEAYVGDVQVVVSMDEIFPEGVSAFATKDMNLGWVVVINGREPLVRQRFSAAHELAHIALFVNQPKKVFCSHRSDDWFEKLCDRFAGDILMPDRLILDFYRSTPSPYLGEVANYFKVSRQVAGIQLGRLGLPFSA